MRAPRGPILALLAALAVMGPIGTPLRAASADEKWGQPYKDLLSLEAHSLLPLMRAAVKQDYRRQARYLASRVLTAEPGQSEASGVLKRWNDAEADAGQVPDANWVKQRDVTLKGLGDKYFHFGETLNGKGVNPVEYAVLTERAMLYGSQVPALLQSLDDGGYAWMGTWRSQDKKAVTAKIGTLLDQVTFPTECDDEFLKWRARWADANVAKFRGWRLLTDLKAEDAMHALYVLAHAENWLSKTVGTATKQDDTVTDLVLFADAEAYDRIGAPLVKDDRDAEKFKGTSGWPQRWLKRLLVCAKNRDNPWIGEDANLLEFAAPFLLRRHSAAIGAGTIQGRGAWLIDGVAGAMAGFKAPAVGSEGGEIVPARSWRLGAAHVLRDRVDLLPWDQLLETDRAAADALPRKTVKMKFAAEEREAKNVDVVFCQGTAFVMGMLLAEGGKGAARLAKLIDDVFKRDRIPDLQKSIGWSNARAFEEAGKALDMADGR